MVDQASELQSPTPPTASAEIARDLPPRTHASPWFEAVALPKNWGADAPLVLNSKVNINIQNEEMANAWMVDDILPVLRQHSRSFEGDTASIVINPKGSPRTPVGNADISQVLRLDLPALESDLKEIIEQSGVPVEKSTLYNIILGNTNLKIFLLSLQRAPKDEWPEINKIRDVLMSRYGVHLRQDFENAPLPVKAECSEVEVERTEARRDRYNKTARFKPLPSRLGNVTDWRGLPFVTYDGGDTRIPEDAFSVRLRKDNIIQLKVAIPFVSTRQKYFSTFDDCICIGLDASIDEGGSVTRFSVMPVIAHSSYQLDHRSAGMAMSASRLGLNAVTSRSQNILDNNFLMDQLRTLCILTNRITAQQLRSFHPVEVDLLSVGNNDSIIPKMVQASPLVGAVLNLSMPLIARAIFEASPGTSLIVNRPRYQEDETTRRISELLPSFELKDLESPEERNRIAKFLQLVGEDGLVVHLADTIRKGSDNRHRQVVRTAEELNEEDAIRLKAKGMVGIYNSIQALSALLGTDRLPEAALTELAETMNREGFTSEDFASRRYAGIEVDARRQAERVLQF